MKALVTGASGFVGRALTRHLVAAGDKVTCLVRPTSDRSQLAPLGVDFAVGDVTRPDGLAEAVAGVDVVYHLAAMLFAPWHPDFVRTNADGVRLILEACAAKAQPPRVVLVSSIAAAGPANGAPRSEDEPPAPVSRYGASKLGGETAARALADRVPITIVRPPLVFGPGDVHLLAAYRAASRGIGVVYSKHAYSMIHVDDLASGLRVAALRGESCSREQPIGRGVYFAADERPFDQPALWGALGLAVGRRVRLLPLPAAVIRAAGAVAEVAGRLGGPSLWSRDKALEATVGSWTCSTAKIRALGWAPAASLEQRLAETGSWYRDQGLL